MNYPLLYVISLKQSLLLIVIVKFGYSVVINAIKEKFNRLLRTITIMLWISGFDAYIY